MSLSCHVQSDFPGTFATSRAIILPGTAWRYRGEKRFSQCLAKYSASKRCGNAPLALFSKVHFSVGTGPLAGASGTVNSKTAVILFPCTHLSTYKINYALVCFTILMTGTLGASYITFFKSLSNCLYTVYDIYIYIWVTSRNHKHSR